MGLERTHTQRLDAPDWLPAVRQGAIGIDCASATNRRGLDCVLTTRRRTHHRRRARMNRALPWQLHGAGRGERGETEAGLYLADVGDAKNRTPCCAPKSGCAGDREGLGREVAEQFLAQGARKCSGM